MTALLRALAVLLALIGAPGTGRAADRLVVALQLEPPTLDPTSGASAAIKEVTYRTIFEGLTTLDATGAPVPLLATGWTMAPDMRSTVFHLRAGVRFQDGTPFDAGVVAFSLTRAIRPGSTNAQAPALREIAGVDVLGPLTVRIRLRAPDAALPVLLAWGDCVMVSPRSAAHLAIAPVGTGPFRFGSWRRGDRLSLIRNAAYWGARPAIGGVEFRFITDASAAYAAMKTHAVELFPDYPAPEQLAQLRADPTLRVSVTPSEGEVILALNNARGPFRDLRVRRAIAHAIDRRAIIEGAMFGYGTPIGSHFPPQNPDHVDLTGRYPFDPARGRALLAAAGYPDGFDAVLTLPPPAYARRSGEIVAAQLRQIGIHVTIAPVEWPQWLDTVFARHRYDMTIVSHAEPADYDIYGRPDYYFGYDGRAVRGDLARLKARVDPRTRHQLLGDIQRRIAEDAVNGFLFQFPHLQVADTRLSHVWANTPLQAVDYGAVRFAGDDGSRSVRGGGSGGASWIIGVVLIAAMVGIGRVAGPAWLLRRLGVLAVTLLGASLFVFALLQVAPGDPAQFMLGMEASPQEVAALRTQLGLEGSAVARYGAWAAAALRGDFGTSYTYRIPVADLVGPRLMVSLPLAGMAMLLSVLLGLGAALAGARRPHGRVDRLMGALAQACIALPGFWLAMLLLLVFVVRLRWAAVSFPGWDAGVAAALGALALPAIALALPQAAVVARVARGALAEELARDYVRTARAKGLRARAILWRHVLPNAAAPILAVIGLQFPFLLAGSVLVENVFALPGVGRLVLQAIGERDLVTVQAVAMLMVVATVLASLLVDVAQMLADPRVRGRV